MLDHRRRRWSTLGSESCWLGATCLYIVLRENDIPTQCQFNHECWASITDDGETTVQYMVVPVIEQPARYPELD